MNAKSNRQQGFSLLELMVALAVVAILAVMAVPTFRDLMRRSQVSSASNTLLASVSYARTEAITRGQLVSMCPSANNGTSCAGGTTFETGWMVYTYPAGAASANTAYDATKATLLRVTTARAGVSIRSNNAAVISFGLQGQLRPSSPTLTFDTCYRSGGSTSAGASTAKTPGVQLIVTGSGSVITNTLAADASCTPS